MNPDIKRQIAAMNAEYSVTRENAVVKLPLYEEYCSDERVISNILRLTTENDFSSVGNILWICETHDRRKRAFAQIEQLLSQRKMIEIVRIGHLTHVLQIQNKHGAMITIRILQDSPIINMYVRGMTFGAAFVPQNSNSFTKVSVQARMIKHK